MFNLSINFFICVSPRNNQIFIDICNITFDSLRENRQLTLTETSAGNIGAIDILVKRLLNTDGSLKCELHINLELLH